MISSGDVVEEISDALGGYLFLGGFSCSPSCRPLSLSLLNKTWRCRLFILPPFLDFAFLAATGRPHPSRSERLFSCSSPLFAPQ